MSRQKCAECGLVNFADQECCKRCKAPLGKLKDEAVARRDQVHAQPDEVRVRHDHPVAQADQGAAKYGVDPDPPSVGSFNGIGTNLLGWRHHEDGTATATVWFTFLFLPCLPLGRWRLLSPSKDDFEPTFSLRQLLAGLLPDKSVTTEFSFVGWLPISGREVFFTYLYAYLWVPFKIFAPIWVLFHFRPEPDKNDGSMTSALIFGPVMMIWFGYVLFVLTRLLHQTRGGR
jgi:hypothetical protein